PADSRLAATARQTPLWVVAAEGAPSDRAAALQARGAQVLRTPGMGGKLELPLVLRMLAERGITRLMVETGPILAAAFVQADLVDEAAIFCSPRALGGDAIGALEGLRLAAVTQSSRLVAAGTEKFGDDTLHLFERPAG